MCSPRVEDSAAAAKEIVGGGQKGQAENGGDAGDGGTDGQELRHRRNRQKGPGRSTEKDSRGREEGRGGKGGERGGSGQRKGERQIKGRRGGDRWTPDRETRGHGGAVPREGTEGERKDGDVWEEMDRWTVRREGGEETDRRREGGGWEHETKRGQEPQEESSLWSGPRSCSVGVSLHDLSSWKGPPPCRAAHRSLSFHISCALLPRSPWRGVLRLQLSLSSGVCESPAADTEPGSLC